MNWDNKDMSEDGIFYRARMKAPDTKFNLDEEKVLVGFVIYRDLTFQSSTTDKFREYDSFSSFIFLLFI
jgi:hypothetical protein